MKMNFIKEKRNKQINKIKWRIKMSYLKENLERKREELERQIRETEKQLAHLPEGKLYARKNGRYYNYYLVSKDGKRTYIPKSKMKYIKKLAQRKYAEKLYVELKRAYKKVEQDINEYEPERLINTYQNLNNGFKELVEPIIAPDEIYAKVWLQYEQEKIKDYPKNNYFAPNEYTSESGEILRSKSETLISEKLNQYNIPFIYEYPLKMKNGKYLYPDFYVLNKRTRKTYYYEHFGMMNNEEYCNKVLLKIDEYARNGIHIGNNLIVTFEAKEKPMRIKMIEDVIINNFIQKQLIKN